MFVENGGHPVFQKLFQTLVGDDAQEAFDAIKMGSGLDGGKHRPRHRGQERPRHFAIGLATRGILKNEEQSPIHQ